MDTIYLLETFMKYYNIIEEENYARNNNRCAACNKERDDWYDSNYYCSPECFYSKEGLSLDELSLLKINGYYQMDYNYYNNDYDYNYNNNNYHLLRNIG